jgi:hypothetical protein
MENLPTVFNDDDDEDYGDRLLQGGRAKWVNKQWTLDGNPPREEDRFLVTGTGFALQRWVDGLPDIITKEPGKSLPSPDDLNDAIPQKEWPIGKFSGKPERAVEDCCVCTLAAGARRGTIHAHQQHLGDKKVCPLDPRLHARHG